MNTIADVTLRWFDESALLEEDPRRLAETFLASLGISSVVAADIFEVLLLARSEDRALRTVEVHEAVLKLRKDKKIEGGKGLGLRNIQVWLRYFKSIKLVDRVGDRVRFTHNKAPSQAFNEYTKQIISESVSFSGRLLGKTERAYGIIVEP